MSKRVQFYRQVTMHQWVNENIGTTCWIDDESASPGKIVKLIDSSTPDISWVVDSVGTDRVPAKLAEERADRWRTYMSEVDI